MSQRKEHQIANGAMTVGICTKCCSRGLVGPLHGDKGGPVMCVNCGLGWHKDWRRTKKNSVFSLFFNSHNTAGETELSKELLEDAIRLTHPDKHPENKKELATRVTAELTALRPHVLPKASVEPRDTSEVGSRGNPPVSVTEPPKREGLRRGACDICIHTIPMYYCDECRQWWDEKNRRERDRLNAQRRRWRANARARKPALICVVCGDAFKGKREDAKTCSSKCRQKAYRDTKKAKEVHS